MDRYAEMLRRSPTYRAAMALARSDDERRRAAAVVDGFVSELATAVAAVAEHVVANPSAAATIRGAGSAPGRVVSVGSPASGSSG